MKRPMYSSSRESGFSPGPRLAAYGMPALALSPSGEMGSVEVLGFGDPSGQAQTVFPSSQVELARPAGQVELARPAGQVELVHPTGQTPPAPITTNGPPPPPPTTTGKGGAPAQVSVAGQQGGGQGMQVAIDPQTATALANLGSTLLQGVRDIAVTGITQGEESARTRARIDAEREIARLQGQGLLSATAAAQARRDAELALSAPAPVAPIVPPQPQGFFASLSTGQKVALGVGGAAAVGGIGFLIYRSMQDR